MATIGWVSAALLMLGLCSKQSYLPKRIAWELDRAGNIVFQIICTQNDAGILVGLFADNKGQHNGLR